jgi:DNA-binding transcriptional LysR family regulator
VAAAKRLRVGPSAVSKQLARLEERLGVRLVERTTRQLRPTAAGLRYGARAQAILRAVDEVEDEARADAGAPRGRLVVSAPLVLGQEVLAALIATYLARYPDVRLDLRLEDNNVDLVSEEVDVAIRIAPALPASGLVSRRLGKVRFLLVASPAYLAEAPPLERARDLARHACLEAHHATDAGMWRIVENGRPRAVRVRGPLVASNLIAVQRAAIAGAGIAQVPEYLARAPLAAGELVLVLPHASLPTRTLHAVHSAGSRASSRVRTFVSFLADALPRAL